MVLCNRVVCCKKKKKKNPRETRAFDPLGVAPRIDSINTKGDERLSIGSTNHNVPDADCEVLKKKKKQLGG